MKNLILILSLITSAQAFAQKQKDNSIPNIHFAMECQTNQGLIRIKSEILTTRCSGAPKNKALQEMVIDSDTQNIGPYYAVKTYSSSKGTYIAAATRRNGYVNFAFNTTKRNLKSGDTLDGVITMSSLAPYEEDAIGNCTGIVLSSAQVKKSVQTVSCGE